MKTCELAEQFVTALRVYMKYLDWGRFSTNAKFKLFLMKEEEARKDNATRYEETHTNHLSKEEVAKEGGEEGSGEPSKTQECRAVCLE